MAKRAAAYQLTAENFDREEEKEDSGKTADGEFLKAAGEVMTRRVIKKAKRRIDRTETEVAANPFSIFGGLTTLASNNGTNERQPTKTFVSNEIKPVTSIFHASVATLQASAKEYPNSVGTALLSKSDSSIEAAGSTLEERGKESNSIKFQNQIPSKGHLKDTIVKDGRNSFNQGEHKGKDALYADQLTALNLSFLQWIKLHIEENPLVDLTPVFKDYRNHMSNIEEKYCKSLPDSVKDALPKILDVPHPVRASVKNEEIKDSDKEGGTNDSETDEPKTIIEENVVFSTRCKLFFKKANDWKELGIGMLYLKSVNSKTQLLVRMETAVGKVLLNISLHKNMPVARVGKNNVSIMSVPNPPVFLKEADGDNTKPLHYLIKVKDNENADELLEHINDNKTEE